MQMIADARYTDRPTHPRHLVFLAPHRFLSLFRQPAGQCRAVPAGGVRAQLSRGQPVFERDRGRHHPGRLAGRQGSEIRYQVSELTPAPSDA
jgi:hypothetical protein